MSEPITVFIPRDSVNDDSARIMAWKLPSGSRVEKDQLICEVETSKALLEIHAPDSGVLAYTAAEGDEVPVGSTICTILPAQDYTELGSERETRIENPEPAGSARLSAAARAAAADLGIDPAEFPAGTLVRREDVLRKAGKLPPPIRNSPAESSDQPADVAAAGVPVEWQDLPRHKLIEGRALNRGRQQAVQSSVTSICRTSMLPSRLKDAGQTTGGLQALIIFEAARLMRKYPVFNAVYDRGRVGLYGKVNAGWALDGGHGLVVPVIADADRKAVPEIASEMRSQLESYLENGLSPSDYLGATFTVTDLSSSGASFFQPLIAPGQSSILGIGQAADDQGQALLYLTLAFDHQVTEGKKAAEFLHDLRERLEIQASLSSEAQRQDASEAPAFCVLCQRDSRTLQRLKLVLLKSEVPPGLVCSLCVAGW